MSCGDLLELSSCIAQPVATDTEYCLLFRFIWTHKSVNSVRGIYESKMPILVKNIEWYQTDDQIIIKIRTQNASARNADVLITETFVKVHFQPYLFETILQHEICPNASVCKILESCIKFVLQKKEVFEWTDLSSTHQSTKSSEGVKLKAEMVVENQTALATESKERRRVKEDEKKANIEREMEREQKIRDQVHRIHEEVKENEKSQQPIRAVDHPIAVAPVMRVEKPKNDIRSEAPPIRSGGTINVSFTARRFVTPQRESQEHAEREWCLKQNQVKKDIGFCDDDLSVDERNPKWLLEKGKEFYGKQNYLAAISAFSAGINLAECPAELLLHRAMAHFKLENYARCVSEIGRFSVTF